MLFQFLVCKHVAIAYSPRASVQRRGKTLARRRSRIPCIVVGKITMHRHEGVGVVVEKMKKVNELSTKNRVIYLQQ